MLRIILFLATLLATAGARAAVLTAGTGDDCDHATVQAALDAAASGDEIRLRTENFSEVVSVQKSLRIVGGFTECTNESPASLASSTLIAPAASDAPVVTVGSGLQVDLIRLRLSLASHSGAGGGLSVGASSTVGVARVAVASNSASLGGGIFVDQFATLRTLEAGSLVEVVGNSATHGGGIYVGFQATLDLETHPVGLVSIRNNSASGNGGGIYHHGWGSLLLTNVTFNLNEAGLGGGGIYSNASNGPGLIRLTNSKIRRSSALTGAGLRVDGNENGPKVLEFHGGELTENVTTGFGGGAHLVGEVSAEFVQVLIGDNEAAHGGGIRANNGPTLVLDDTTLSGNHATTDGGALQLVQVDWSAGAAQLPVEFNGNSAAGRGGAIHQVGGSGVLGGSADHPIRLADNQADSGGAVHIAGGQLLLAPGLEFIENHALTSGGAIHARSGAVVRSNGAGSPDRRIVFNGNQVGDLDDGLAAAVGGAILVENADLEAAWMQIGGAPLPGREYANSTARYGGGLAVVGGQVRLYNSVVAGNFAGDEGGGILVFGDDAQPSSLYFGAVYPETAGNPATGIDVSPCLLDDLPADRYCAEIEGNFRGFGASGSAVLAWGENSQVEVEIERTAIRDNGDGAILARGASDMGLRNVLVRGHANVALGVLGRTLSGAPADAVLRLDHSTVTDNGDNTLVLVASDGSATLHIRRSIVWGNDAALLNLGGTIESSCNISQSADIGGLMADPRLALSDRGPYRLRFDSPALDLCVDSPEFSDLDGAPRPQGAAFDAGAFEGVAVLESIFANGFEAD